MKYLLLAIGAIYFFGGHGAFATLGMRILGLMLIIMIAIKVPRLMFEMLSPTRRM